MLPSEVVRRAAEYLDRHEVQSPLADAEALLAGVLGTDRTGIYRRTEGLSSVQAKIFGRALCRRCVGTPLQHITGEQGFRRLILQVRPGVFVPRPETEVVVEVGLSALRGSASPAVLDLGCGSGTIALSIADEHPGATVLAVDRAPEAVALTRENAERLGLAVHVYEGDLWDGVPSEWRGRLDMVITNPPYLEAADPGLLPADVRADPQAALVGGLAMHGRIIDPAFAWLRSGGTFVTEIGDDQGESVAALAETAGFLDITVHEDLNSRARAISGRKP